MYGCTPPTRGGLCQLTDSVRAEEENNGVKHVYIILWLQNNFLFIFCLFHHDERLHPHHKELVVVCSLVYLEEDKSPPVITTTSTMCNVVLNLHSILFIHHPPPAKATSAMHQQ
jgi:hypothetical protein